MITQRAMRAKFTQMATLVGLTGLIIGQAVSQNHTRSEPDYGPAIRAGASELVETGQIPNAITLIAEDNKIVFRDAQGWQDVSSDIAASEAMLFRHFSSSKPMTCAAIMTLVDDGLVDIEAPVESYLPAFSDMQVRTSDGLVPAERDITIRDLMTHTSGIVYGQSPSLVSSDYTEANVNAIANRIDESLTQHNQRLAEMPLVAQPGTEWNYGESMGVLGGVVEAVSGQSFGDYLQSRLFTPLEMTDTGFFAADERAGRLSQLYMRDEEGRSQPVGDNPGFGGDYRKAPALEYGGAGLVGTAGDAMNFLLMLLNGGEFNGKRILSKESVALMTTDQLDPAFGSAPISFGFPDPRWENVGFGFCGLVVRPGAEGHLGAAGEYGWSGWAGTDIWIDPEANRAVVIATQAIPNPASGLDYPLSTLVRTAIYGD